MAKLHCPTAEEQTNEIAWLFYFTRFHLLYKMLHTKICYSISLDLRLFSLTCIGAVMYPLQVVALLCVRP